MVVIDFTTIFCVKLGFMGMGKKLVCICKRTHTVRPYKVCANINFISHSERQRNFVEGALASRYKIEEQSDEGIYKGILVTFLVQTYFFYSHIKYFFALEGIPKLHYRSLCKQRF